MATPFACHRGQMYAVQIETQCALDHCPAAMDSQRLLDAAETCSDRLLTRRRDGMGERSGGEVSSWTRYG